MSTPVECSECRERFVDRVAHFCHLSGGNCLADLRRTHVQESGVWRLRRPGEPRQSKRKRWEQELGLE